MNLSRQRGAALGKVLLLLFFIALAIGYWVWRDRYGVIGDVHPIDFPTKDHVGFFRQEADGKTNLYVVKLDGTGERQLTQDEGHKQGLTWSPDGTQLCYSAEQKDESVAAYQLFMFGSSGSRQLTSGTGSKHNPDWRPDGDQIAFLASGAVKVVDPNGNNMEQVYPHMHKGGAGEEGGDEEETGLKRPPIALFRWAPEGGSIAAVQIAEGEQALVQGRGDWFRQKQRPQESPQIVADPEMLLVLPAGGEEPVMRPETNATKVGFSWFPDGKRIAVSMSTRTNQHGLAILRADEPSMQPTPLFASGNKTVAAENPSVSPDGSKVAFEVWKIDSAENRELLGIAVMSTEPSQPLVIRAQADMSKVPLVVKGKTTNPIWSRDSARIVYQVTGTSGRRDLWSAGADGSQPVNLTNGKGDNYDAACSPAR